MVARAKLTVSLPDKATQKLLQEWVKRAERMRPEFLRLAVEAVHEDLVSNIPRTPDLLDYRDGLSVAQVEGVRADESAYAIHVDVRRSRVRKVDGPKTLLYVRPKRGSRRVPDEVRILERFNPWTIDTLPFTPSKRVAVLISRKVNRREVNRVSALRQGDKDAWGRALRKAGARWADKEEKKVKIPKKLQAMPEIAVTALKLEFGLGTETSKAHWRPAISRLRKNGWKRILRENKDLELALYDPKFRGWKKWPKQLQDKVRLGEAKNYAAFQKRLDIRA